MTFRAVFIGFSVQLYDVSYYFFSYLRMDTLGFISSHVFRYSSVLSVKSPSETVSHAEQVVQGCTRTRSI